MGSLIALPRTSRPHPADEPGSLQEVVDGLAAVTGVPVTLEDAHLRLLAHSTHGPVVDGPRQATIMSRRAPDWTPEWMRRQGLLDITDPVRVPADPAVGQLARVVAPVRRQGRLHGWVWLLDAERRLDNGALTATADAAAVAGRLLAEGRWRGPAVRDPRDHLINRLLDPDAVVRDGAAEEAGSRGLLEEGPVRVLVADADYCGASQAGRSGVMAQVTGRGRGAPGRTAAALAAWRLAVAQLPARWAHALVHEGLLIALIGGTTRHTPDIPQVSRVHQALAATGYAATVGMGAVQPRLDGARISLEQARGALLVAEQVAATGGIACWESMGAYRALLALPQPVDVGLLDPRVAAAVTDGLDPVLLFTVETFLEEGASPGRTARRMQVHRGTVYYRIQRFCELVGCDLDDGGDRLSVHLALKALRLTHPAAPPPGPQSCVRT